MAWQFDPDRPIYLQIAERLAVEIVSGRMDAASKAPTVRELALEAGVNPNTAQRALAELERGGYLETRRGDGRYITEGGRSDAIRLSSAAARTTDYVTAMRALGFSDPEILGALHDFLKGDAPDV